MKCWLWVSLHLRWYHWCPEMDPQLQPELSRVAAAGNCHEPFAQGFIQGPALVLELVLLQGLYEHPELGGCCFVCSWWLCWLVKVGTGNLHYWLFVQGSREWGIRGNLESGLQGLVLAPGLLSHAWQNHSICKANCSSAGEDGELRCSAALQPLCISRPLIHPQ